MIKDNYSVFYSWQSDLPNETNLNALRQVLREAASHIENELDEIKIDIDEATRNATGSPNIPQMIFRKIENCDIFVCDLTTINSTGNDLRKVPNPNVLIELGFAIAMIGWERIIILFNKVHGNFPNDLPFDIDRHRATPFNITDKKDNDGKKQIANVLKGAIKAIIVKSPLKPHEQKTISPEQRKRELDIKNLSLALNAIHIPTFDNFIEYFPNRVRKEIFYFKNCFLDITESNTFFIYDQNLLEKITAFKQNWIISLSYAKHYYPDNVGSYTYHIPMDIFPSQKAEDDFHFLEQHIVLLEYNLKELLNYVRLNYIEIDLEETSKNAFESYQKYVSN
jgi:hypothetical protein